MNVPLNYILAQQRTADLQRAAEQVLTDMQDGDAGVIVDGDELVANVGGYVVRCGSGRGLTLER